MNLIMGKYILHSDFSDYFSVIMENISENVLSERERYLLREELHEILHTTWYKRVPAVQVVMTLEPTFRYLKKHLTI